MKISPQKGNFEVLRGQIIPALPIDAKERLIYERPFKKKIEKQTL